MKQTYCSTEARVVMLYDMFEQVKLAVTNKKANAINDLCFNLAHLAAVFVEDILEVEYALRSKLIAPRFKLACEEICWMNCNLDFRTIKAEELLTTHQVDLLSVCWLGTPVSPETQARVDKFFHKGT